MSCSAVITDPWSSPLNHIQWENTHGEQQVHLRTQVPLSFTPLVQRDVHRQAQMEFFPIDGACPDPRLLLKGNDKPPQRYSPTCPSYWKQQIPSSMEAEDSREHIYHHHGAHEGTVPRLDNFDPTECSLLPKHPKTRWVKMSPLGWACLLPTVKPRGRWMALGSHWSEKEEGQSTKAICRHAGTPAEQGGSKTWAPGPCWEPQGSCSLHQSNRAEQGHSSICHSPQQGSGRPQIHAKHHSKGIFPSNHVQEPFFLPLLWDVYVPRIAKNLWLQALRSDC